MCNRLLVFMKDEEGASVVEYGLLLALIMVACAAAVNTLGQKSEGSFRELETRWLGD